MREILINTFAAGAATWGSTLLEATVKGVLLLAFAGIITLLLRRAPAATRHFVWTVAISALVLLPVVGVVAPRWNAPILSASIAPSLVPPSSTAPSKVETGKRPDAVDAPVPSTATPNAPPAHVPLASPRKEIAQSLNRAESVSHQSTSTPAPFSATPERPTATSTRSTPVTSAVSPSAPPVTGSSATIAANPRRSFSWWAILSMIWVTGVVVLMSRILFGVWGTARLARTSEIVEDPEWIALVNRLARQFGITRPVTLLRSDRSGIPMTWGVFYPVILLPDDSDTWSKDRRVTVLLHELAHVRRFDALTQSLAHIATAIFWVNPLVWLASRQMRTERERACDDFVLSAGMRPSAYASDLLEIVRTMGNEPRLAYAALAMARRSEFEGRLIAILDPKARRNGLGRRGKLATAGFAIVLVFPLAGMRPAVRVSTVDTNTTDAVQVAQASRDSVQQAAVVQARADTAVAIRDSVRSASVPARSVDFPKAAIEAEARLDSASPVPLVPAPVRGADLPRDDKQTLILIVRAAAKMTSDYEKAALLIEVLDKFVADDSLRAAFLATTATLTSDYERQRVLTAMLAKDELSNASRVMFIKAVGGLTSDYSRRTVLLQFAAKHDLENAAVRQAFFASVNAMSAGYDQQQVLVGVLKRIPRLTRDEALGLLAAAKSMSSSANKSAVLVAVAEKIGLTDDVVRKAYIDTAGTLSSDSDYRRAMSAAIKFSPPQQQ